MDDVQYSGSFSDAEMLDDMPLELPAVIPASSHAAPVIDGDLLEQDFCSNAAVHAVDDLDLYAQDAYLQEIVDPDEACPSIPEMTASTWREQVVSPAKLKDDAPGATSVLAKIEAIFEAMADVLLNERGQLSIDIKTRPKAKRQLLGPADPTPAQREQIQRICFPGKSEKEAWRFAVVTRILELMHEALCNDVVLSKRDIYYRDPALFGRQSHVDRYVDDIAYTFGVSQSALHVIAAAKGLITGAVSFCRRDGTTVEASADREGLLMPNLKDILSASMAPVRWILVIEKEATFRSIAASDFWDTLSTSGIMVTAKGYPDIATRAMLRFLSSATPQNNFAAPPVYALVDYDPDGIAILSTYRHGSANLAHETFHLRLPQMQWLGLRSEQILGSDEMHSDQGLLTLSVRDRKKARKMLEWEVLAHDDELRRELQTMLMLNVKAELQLLDAMTDGMNYLLEKYLPV